MAGAALPVRAGRLLRAVAVHLPAVVLFSFAHIAAMEAVHWWLAYSAGKTYAWWSQVQRAGLLYVDWEMMTYWAIVGLTHALVYYRESRSAGRAGRAARDQAGRSPAEDAAAAAPPALPVQHAPRDLGADAQGRAGRRPRADAAERSAAHHARASRQPGGGARGRARGAREVPRDRADAVRRSSGRALRHPAGNARHAACRACCSSRWSRTPSSTAWRGKSGTGHIDISARREGDKLRLEVRDDGIGLSEDALTALQKGIGVSTTRARLQHLFGADYPLRVPPPRAGPGGDRRRCPGGPSRAPATAPPPTTPPTAPTAVDLGAQQSGSSPAPTGPLHASHRFEDQS